MDFFYHALQPLLEYVYNVPLPKNVRDNEHPLQVIALGPSRSGTESISRALEILGYESYHGLRLRDHPDEMKAWCIALQSKWTGRGPVLDRAFFDSIYGNYTAITDLPSVAFHRELRAAYPDALFILNTRPPEVWYTSYTSALKPYFAPPQIHELFGTSFYWLRRMVDAMNATFFHADPRTKTYATAKWVYEDHAATVRGSIPHDRLLEWQPQDGWEPLCKFLAKEIPDQKFPHGNSLNDYLVAKAKRLQDSYRAAYWNMALVGALSATGLGVGWWGVIEFIVHR